MNICPCTQQVQQCPEDLGETYLPTYRGALHHMYDPLQGNTPLLARVASIERTLTVLQRYVEELLDQQALKEEQQSAL